MGLLYVQGSDASVTAPRARVRLCQAAMPCAAFPRCKPARWAASPSCKPARITATQPGAAKKPGAAERCRALLSFGAASASYQVFCESDLQNTASAWRWNVRLCVAAQSKEEGDKLQHVRRRALRCQARFHMHTRLKTVTRW